MQGQYLLIPVEMCDYALRNKCVREVQLYVYLKSICDGRLLLAKGEFKLVSEDLGLKSVKTIRRHLNALQGKNWIGYSKELECYYIRGFEAIRRMEGFDSRTGAEFDIREIKSIKAFICGAVIGYLVTSQKRKEWLTERKNRRSQQVIHSSSKYYPVAGKALAKILNISISTAHEHKRLAHKAGYVTIKNNRRLVKVDVKYVDDYRRSYPDIAHKVRVINDKVFIQEPDKVRSNLRFKSRKKIESYITDP